MPVNREVAKRRKRECIEALARRGEDAGLTPVQQLQRALESLGGGFALFGRYLGSRVDLLPVRDCLVFSDTDERTGLAPVDDVPGLFKNQMGRSLEEAYADFEGVPFECRLLYQVHRARLHSGQDATVKILRPDASARLGVDWPLFEHLEGAFADFGWADGIFAASVKHFQTSLVMNVTREREGLQALTREIQAPDVCQAPGVYPALCSAGILTVARLPGHSLDRAESATEDDRRTLARSVCRAWLSQVLHRYLFPVAPDGEDLWALPDGRIAFTGGQLARLSADAQENIWAYLEAAATRDPERACRGLLRDMAAGRTACGEVALQHQFRQVVPFRDGGWGEVGRHDTLAEHLFVHWRLAVAQGYRPRPWLLDFFRGLFLISAAAHRLAPDVDAVMAAVSTHRDHLGRDQFENAFDMGRWRDAMDFYAATVSELPQKADDLLTRAADGQLKLKFRIREAPEHRRERNTSAISISLLLVLIGVVLMVYHLSDAMPQAHQAGAVVFALVGGLLLWVMTRGKK